ncbi:DUF2827 family protein [Pelagibaculum spongiae]|uniref:DUF2827 domain-containing protein n=1 Tax=Pelagibaculum spongiae TaxID=2080658 RepID=A0A2V1GN44_9GAMM|nr:DUF2827 family protein [Pelagibaculum spongiae]PVZ62950.1 hypothetical protein DC094_21520 [Pelagibaculum spongiae]
MGFNIGITFRDDVDQHYAIFSNGISQNLKFLYDLFELLGHRVWFLTGGEPNDAMFNFHGKKYRAKTTASLYEKKTSMDLVFEAGVTIDKPVRELIKNKTNAKIVSLRLGCSLIIDMEQLFLNTTLQPGLHISQPDVLWTTPHLAFGKSYFATLYDTEVKVCPYIWEPDFIGQPFKNSERPSCKDIYVMEPNISVLKNALIPMSIIEQTFRNDADSFGRATIVNGAEFHADPYFLDNIAVNLKSSWAETKKMYFSTRCTFDEAFQRPDVLLGHQWGCELNYLYCEALYRGVPLVHNSEMMKEVGYYYPEFEVGLGAGACSEALAATDIESEVEKNHKWLHRFSIHNKSVQNTYRELIAQVINS